MKKQQNKRNRFTTVYGLLMIDSTDISYIHAQNNYSLIKDTLGHEHFVCHSLKEVEDILCQQTFFRLHKSYIVNINKIYQFHKKGEGSVLLRCGAVIPIGRTFRVDLQTKLLAF